MRSDYHTPGPVVDTMPTMGWPRKERVGFGVSGRPHQFTLADLEAIVPVISPGIYDISNHGLQADFKDALEDTLSTGEPFPKEVVYLNPGDSWDRIAQESYQTREELDMIRENLEAIYQGLRRSTVIFELGPGNFIKSEALLDRLEEQRIHRYYFAADVNQYELSRIRKLNSRYEYITCVGLLGTFDQALELATKLSKKFDMFRNGGLVSFGSTLSNNQAVDQLVQQLDRWRQIAAYILLGQDGSVVDDKVHATYHTAAYNQLMRKGLEEADRIVGRPVFSSATPCGCEISEGPSSHAFAFEIKDGSRSTRFEAFRSVKYTETDMRNIIMRSRFGSLACLSGNNSTMKLYAMYR